MQVFDILKLVKVNHGDIPVQSIVMTDPAGKPNSILTDLLHDVLGKMQLFVDMSDMYDAEDVIEALHNVTPLRDDVLDEYDKILTQEVSGLNFAPHKQEIEIVYDELVG